MSKCHIFVYFLTSPSWQGPQVLSFFHSRSPTLFLVLTTCGKLNFLNFVESGEREQERVASETHTHVICQLGEIMIRNWQFTSGLKVKYLVTIGNIYISISIVWISVISIKQIISVFSYKKQKWIICCSSNYGRKK